MEPKPAKLLSYGKNQITHQQITFRLSLTILHHPYSLIKLFSFIASVKADNSSLSSEPVATTFNCAPDGTPNDKTPITDFKFTVFPSYSTLTSDANLFTVFTRMLAGRAWSPVSSVIEYTFSAIFITSFF